MNKSIDGLMDDLEHAVLARTRAQGSRERVEECRNAIAALLASPAPAEPADARPTEPGLYAWVPEHGTPSLVLVDRRPSEHSPGNVLNGHVIGGSSFYGGCAISKWPERRWINLRAPAQAAPAVPAGEAMVHVDVLRQAFDTLDMARIHMRGSPASTLEPIHLAQRNLWAALSAPQTAVQRSEELGNEIDRKLAAYGDEQEFSPELTALADRAAAQSREQPQPVHSLSALDELAKVYASSYASPHHITFTVEGLRNFIAAASDTAAGAQKPKGPELDAAPLPTDERPEDYWIRQHTAARLAEWEAYRKLNILASFVHEVQMGAYEDMAVPAKLALERVGLSRLDDVVALNPGAAPPPADWRDGPPLTWTDGDGMKHTMGRDSVQKFVSEFYERWPGGFEEHDAALQAPAPLPVGDADRARPWEAMAAEYQELMTHMDAGGDYFEFMAKRQHPDTAQGGQQQ